MGWETVSEVRTWASVPGASPCARDGPRVGTAWPELGVFSAVPPLGSSAESTQRGREGAGDLSGRSGGQVVGGVSCPPNLGPHLRGPRPGPGQLVRW